MTGLMSMRTARRLLALSQQELSAVAKINQAIISQIESGRRSPSPIQRQRICTALQAEITFLKEDFKMSNVPTVPEPKWLKNGKPDFSQFETNETGFEGVKIQLARLITEDLTYLDPEAGDSVSIKEVFPDSVIFQVVQNGQSMFYKQSYSVQNDEVSLRGDVVEARVTYETLSRRRIPKTGVPDLPEGHYEGQGVHRRFVVAEDD